MEGKLPAVLPLEVAQVAGHRLRLERLEHVQPARDHPGHDRRDPAARVVHRAGAMLADDPQVFPETVGEELFPHPR